MQKLIVAGLTFIVLTVSQSASAQNLQGAGASLQQQQGSTQNTGTIQNKTGTTENTSGSVNPFSQTQRSSLGVVSSPNQSTPSASVAPSTTLTAQQAKRNNSSKLWLIGVLLVIAVVSGFMLYRMTRSQPSEISTEPDQTLDQPTKKDKKKKQKKRRKSTPGRR